MPNLVYLPKNIIIINTIAAKIIDGAYSGILILRNGC